MTATYSVSQLVHHHAVAKKRRQPKKGRGSKAQTAKPRATSRPRVATPRPGFLAAGDEKQDSSQVVRQLEDRPLDLLEEEIPHLKHFWSNVLKATGCEPRSVEAIRGASGVPHRLIAAGID